MSGSRPWLVLLHRWAGLALAGFLAVLGATGGILAFEDELDIWLSPHLHRVASSGPGAPLLDPVELARRAEAALPRAQFDVLPLVYEPDRSVRLRLRPQTDPATGRPYRLDYNEAFFDPHDGRLLGTRMWGALAWDRGAFTGFVYRLHSMLALPPLWGRLLLGLIAVAWTLDCFFGLLLTLPRRQKRGRTAAGGPAPTAFGIAAWGRRWRPAWMVKRGAGAARLNLDLHRAGGLWTWIALLVFAWSSVMFTLRDQVYLPVMSLFVGYDQPLREMPARAAPVPAADALGWQAALDAARAHARELAPRHGWRVDGEVMLAFSRPRGVYSYWLHTDLDVRDGDGSTGLIIDAATGALHAVVLPRHPEAAGNAFDQWMYGLHMAQVFGLPYRILVLLLGFGTAGLAVTGVLVWWKKHAARRHASAARGAHRRSAA